MEEDLEEPVEVEVGFDKQDIFEFEENLPKLEFLS